VSRAYPPRPIVGIGVVVLRPGEVLLVRRGKPPRAGVESLALYTLVIIFVKMPM
jgi:8-oxo-dGTP diphosphatase